MIDVFRRMTWDRIGGLVFVLALHGAALYGLWSYRILPLPADAPLVFVNLVNPPPQEVPKSEPPKPVKVDKLERPRPVEKPQPQEQLVVEAPVTSPVEPTAPPPPPAPLAPVVAAPPAGPVTLTDDLSLTCPERTPPAYPAVSRRRGETGRVVLRVELDERGLVGSVQVATSSGSTWLDDAALAAVRQWRCNPARRAGQPVRAVALQPFNFTLEGR